LEELNQWLIPLVGASPLDLTDDDLSFLDQLRDTKIVALGEAKKRDRRKFLRKQKNEPEGKKMLRNGKK
jgi:hypothetical protein